LVQHATCQRPLLGDVEPEVTDLTVPDDVVLPLQTELTARSEVGERPLDGHQLLVTIDFGTDEAASDVRMHGAGGVLGPGAGRNRPCPHLVLTSGEKGHQTE